MEVSKKDIENKIKDYNYAWIHSYDKLEILDLDKKKPEIDDKLIELRLFNKKEEYRVKFIEGKYEIKVSKDKELSDTIEDQQVIANNKVKSGGIDTGLNKNRGKYILKFEKILGYDDEGQAYIKDQRLIDIEYKKFTIEKGN